MRTFPDPLLRRWTRRAISWSITISAFLILLLLSPIWIVVCCFIDVLFWGRVASFRGTLFVFSYLFFEMVGMSLCGWVWLRHSRNPERYREKMYWAQFIWAKGLIRSAIRAMGLRVHIHPQYEFTDRKVIVATRHCSIADTLVPMQWISIDHDKKLPFVMKRELEWDPSIDLAVSRLEHLFVVRGSGDAGKEISKIGKLITLDHADGVVIFPEGTRYSHEKRDRILQKLEESGDADTLKWAQDHPYVLPPRTGGMLELLKNNEEADVVFISHAGFENAVSFRQAFNGSLIDADIHITYWGVAYEDIPKDPEARKQWFFDEWAKVNAFVAEKL